MATKSLLGYNPNRDSEGKFDDGPSLLASRGRPKVSASDQRKKIDEVKAKLRAQYSIAETKPEREKVLEGPQYIETPGFAINEKNLSDHDVRTILWKDKDLFPGKTYGQYYEAEKAKKGDIFMMTPAEYRQALIESGQYKDLESIEKRMDWEKVDQYTEDMMSGDKFPPPQLVYDEDGKTQQEGLHRLYAAERVGIERVPVAVSSDTRNQDIYPYNELSDKVLSQDDIFNKNIDGGDDGGDGGDGDDFIDDSAIESIFYGVSALGEEHTKAQAIINDPKSLPSEIDAAKAEEKRLNKEIKAEVAKAVKQIQDGEYNQEFLANLEQTIEAEQAKALNDGNETYLTHLDGIMQTLFDKGVAERNTSTDASESNSSPHLYNNQWPDYNMTAPEGYTILYTNTKSENVDAIMADGLKVGLNADGYRLSPEEGNQVWTDTRSPGSMAYGGNTVAFKVKNEEAEAGKVNETQHAIPHDIAPEDIMFVDKVLKSDSGVKVSNLPEYIEKYGEEKAITVTAKTGDGFSEQELRNLISVYKSQSAAPATVEQEQDISQSEGAQNSTSKSLEEYQQEWLGTKVDDVKVVDMLSDPETLREEARDGKLKDGIYEGGNDYLYEVKDNEVIPLKEYRAKYNFQTGEIDIFKREPVSDDIRQVPIFHNTDAEITQATDLDLGRSGQNFGGVGGNEFDAIYFRTDPTDDTFGKNTVVAKLTPDAKVIEYSALKKEYRENGSDDQTLNEYAKENYDVVTKLDDVGEAWEVIVLNAKVINNPEGPIVENAIKAKALNQISARDFAKIYKDLDIDIDNLGCIMLDLEPMKVMEYIEGHEDDLYENPKWDQGSVPAETVPHVTLLYGLLENGNKWKKKVDMVLKDWSIKSVTVEEVGYFDTPDSYAVVAHLEKTPELVDGHERLTLLPHINTFSEYKPHTTLAYVKKDADPEVWVKALNRVYKGKKIKASAINYGDKPKDIKKNASETSVEASLARSGSDHNAISPAGLIVAYNALDSDSLAIIKDQELRLKNGFADVERRIVEAATQKVAKNYLDDPTDIIAPADREKFVQEVEALLTTFYINLYPVFGQQLLSKRAVEYGVTTPYMVSQESQAYIQEMAAKAATSHVNTVIMDILTAASLAYALAIGAALVTLVVAAVAAGSFKIKKKLMDNGYTYEDTSIREAVEAGLFDKMDVYKEAQKLARKGEGQAKIVQSIRAKYPEISKNRATTIARTESARVFNQSQYEADRQFLVANGLMDKAYKKLRSRTGTPCDHCNLLIKRPPIPFETNFADLGTQITVTDILDNGDVKVRSLPVNWESIKAGNVHPNCNCEYVLIIKD